MKRHMWPAIIVMLSVGIPNANTAYACGEKLLTLGRGIRFQSRHSPRPASVLLYLPQSASGRPLSDPNLESALREAGHAVRAVTTSADLESALRSSTYDVVLANVTDAPTLERAQALTAGNAVVLPAVYLVAPTPQAKRQTPAAGLHWPAGWHATTIGCRWISWGPSSSSVLSGLKRPEY